MARAKNNYTYCVYPASGVASICSHFTSVFPNGFSPVTHDGVDYYVLDNGTACDMASEHAAMKAVCDGHTYPQTLLDELKTPVAEETAKSDAHDAAIAVVGAPPEEHDPTWQANYQTEYDNAYDLAAAMAATPNPDPASVNQAQAKHFVSENQVI